MINATIKRRIAQVLPFGFITFLFGLVYSFLEQGILGNATHYPSTGNPYHFSPWSSGLLAMVGGLLIGAIEVLYLNRQFQKTTFVKKIAYKTVLYVLLLASITFVITITNHALDLQKSPMDAQVIIYSLAFFRSFAFWSVEMYMAMGIGMSLFYTEVSDNLGPAVLLNFFTGKYHQPVEEDRIFMFLDMKDSTTIAESLGHVQYFELLRSYYADLTSSIVAHRGEIYQYVGDEVVVSWAKQQGLQNNNCLQCFFNMKKALENKTKQYQTQFGVAPTFKAGIHLGKVTTGEIGVVKKEIAFSGDVLNTTARIQALCNHYQVELLVSQHLSDAFLEPSAFQFRPIGAVELRGRDEKVNLFAVADQQ